MSKQKITLFGPSAHAYESLQFRSATQHLRPLRLTKIRLTGALLGAILLTTATLPPAQFGTGPKIAQAKDKQSKEDKKAAAKAAAESLARPTEIVTAVQPKGKILLPESTRVKLVLLDELKSNKMEKGDVVRYALLEDLKGPNGVILIPKGISASGVISKAKGAGGLGRKGSLEFTADSISTFTQEKVALRSSQSADGKSNGGAVVALSILISPLALFMKGKNIRVPAGEIIEAYIDAPTTLNSGAFENMKHHDVDAVVKQKEDSEKK